MLCCVVVLCCVCGIDKVGVSLVCVGVSVVWLCCHVVMCLLLCYVVLCCGVWLFDCVVVLRT